MYLCTMYVYVHVCIIMPWWAELQRHTIVVILYVCLLVHDSGNSNFYVIAEK